MFIIKKEFVFICIGTTSVVGDCLGPLVGSFLKCKFNEECSNVKIYGDLCNPVDFNNVDKVVDEINRLYGNCIKVIVDSALGDIYGDILIDDGNMCIGEGLNKRKVVEGNINIRGVVGRNYCTASRNINELMSRNINDIAKLANEITNLISV